MSQLGDALFTETQQRVLGLLYGRPDRSFYTNEILRRTGMGVATIKRELDRMRNAGILTLTRVGNQHHYQADPRCPIYSELIAIVKKTFGVTEVVGEALVGLQDKISWAFVYGSIASGKERAGSDIDLMIIGDVEFAGVVGALSKAQDTLGREINPKIFSEKEWLRMKKRDDAFYKEVMNKARIDVLGSSSEPG